MLVLLPPSETKRVDATGEPLDLTSLSFPELNRARKRAVSALVQLGRTPRTAARVLELGPAQRDEITRNAELRTAPTSPAIDLYTGVLYDALDAVSLTADERGRAAERISIGSALFGLVRAEDPIPAYRLSAGTTLPKLGSLTKLWKPAVVPLLTAVAERELIVDLRSGAYQSLAPAPDAVTVRVLTERPDGSRSVVSHFNKATKGRVARLLVQEPTPCASAEDVLAVLRAGGLECEQHGPLRLDVITR